MVSSSRVDTIGPMPNVGSAAANPILQMSLMGVRREKAALSSGCESTRQPLQPEATGAGMEVTKCLKPSGRRATNRWQRECAGRNASERRASLEKEDAQADPATLPGKADITGRMSKVAPPVAVPG